MMSDDLVATLEALGEDDFYYFPATTKAVIDRAVAEIDRLRPRNKEMEAALQDIASGRYSNVLLPTHPPQDPAVVRARAALEEGE